MYNSNIKGNAVFYVTRGESGQTFEGNVAVRSLRWQDYAKISKLLGFPSESEFKIEAYMSHDDADDNYLVLSDPDACRPYTAIIIVKFHEIDDEEVMVDVDAKEDKGFVDYAIERYMLDEYFDVVDILIERDFDPEEAGLLTQIGDACVKGMLFRKDLYTARMLYETAAKAGDAEAMRGLGNLYMDGLGVYQNVPIAEEYYMMAAKGGSVMALIDLGTLYARDEYGMLDSEKSMKCFRAAAEKVKKENSEKRSEDSDPSETENATGNVTEKAEENGERSGI